MHENLYSAPNGYLGVLQVFIISYNLTMRISRKQILTVEVLHQFELMYEGGLSLLSSGTTET